VQKQIKAPLGQPQGHKSASNSKKQSQEDTPHTLHSAGRGCLCVHSVGIVHYIKEEDIANDSHSLTQWIEIEMEVDTKHQYQKSLIANTGQTEMFQ